LAKFPRHKRILLLGPTGVDKATAAKRLSAYLENQGHSFAFADFENDYLKKDPGVKSWTHFLAQDLELQALTWKRVWDEFKKSLTDETIVLGLHATYVSGLLGLRCPIHISSICNDFQPTLIISLIDDVYSMWKRTEDRAGGRDDKGRPSFEQLLMARRAEQTLGDLILTHLPNRGARHILCATGNTLAALSNVLVFGASTTYLSFPISAPRELAADGKPEFIGLINAAHRQALAEMKSDHDRAFISPLAIDELPMVGKAKELVDASKDAKSLNFNCAADRWRLDELWGDPNAPIVLPDGADFSYPIEQIGDARGLMRTDVGWRDRRLVMQSESLAILCPKPPHEDRITRGVETEIETAILLGIPCSYWQKPEWDPKDFVGNRYSKAGSMGAGHSQAFIKRVDSLDDLIRAKP
jgi:hypothetical protein